MLARRQVFLAVERLGAMWLFALAVAACVPAPPATESLGALQTTPGFLDERMWQKGTEEGATPLPTLAPDVTPTSADYVRLGDAAQLAGDLPEAIAYYDQAIALDAGNAVAYHNRGLAYASSGVPDLAIANFTEAMVLAPDYPSAYYNRGVVYYSLGNLEQALLDFSEAIRIDPTFAQAYRGRAHVQSDMGFPGVAAIDLEVYLALAPDADDFDLVQAWRESLLLQSQPPEPDGDLSRLFDDFSDPGSGWISYGSAPGIAEYSDGGYRLVVTVAESVVWARPTYWFSDVRIEVEARKDGGPDDNFFGVMCRYASSENFYVLVISSDGYYGIGRRLNGGDLELTGMSVMRRHSAIKQGSATNQIAAECVGNKLRLWANGVLLAEVTDSSISAGDVGIIAGAYTIKGTNIWFDNFRAEAVEQ